MCYAVIRDDETVCFQDSLQDAVNEAKMIAAPGVDIEVYQRVRVVKVETKTVVEEV